MTICLEAATPGINGMNWTGAIPTHDELLAQDNVHNTFFKFQGSPLIPSEFAEDPSPLKDQNILSKLLIDVARYLSENDLTDLIAIVVKGYATAHDGGDKRTSKLEMVWGPTESPTVVLPFDGMAKGVMDPVPTSWDAWNYNPASDPDEPPPGEHWNKASKSDGSETHKVHVDSVELISPELLHDAFVAQGYVVKA